MQKSSCRPLPYLLELPNELLLSIATKLEKNSDLCQLSLVNQELRHIAQDVLVKEVLLPRNSIRKLIQTLCDRPDLGPKVKSIDLGEYQPERLSVRGLLLVVDPGPGDVHELDNSDLFQKCRTLVDSINGHEHFDAILKALGTHKDGLWTANRQYFLNVLVALTPNLVDITVKLPDMNIHDITRRLLAIQGGFPRKYLVEPFQGLALQVLQERLRVLTIPQNYHMHNITLCALSKLVRLNVPMDALLPLNVEAPSVADLLPSTLEHLQLRPCNKHILKWLAELVRAHLGGKLPYLRRLDLYFRSCLRSSLLWLTQGENLLGSFYDDVRKAMGAGIVVQAYGASDGLPMSLLEELEAWSYLSDFEAWLTASRGEQFTSAVARTEGGTPRRRTKEEARVFLKSHEKPGMLRRILTFSPQVSLDGVSTPSFHKKNVPTMDGLRSTLDLEAWRDIQSSFTCTAAGMASTSSWSLLEVESLRRENQGPVNNSLALENSLYRSDSLSATLKFDPNEWLNVEFFTNSETPPRSPARSWGWVRAMVARVRSQSRSPSPRPRRLK